MPLARVRKPFPFSRDGITLQHAEFGDVHDFPASMLNGLLAEGWVELLRAPPAPAPTAPVSNTPPAAAAVLAAAGPGADVVEAASKPAKGKRA